MSESTLAASGGRVPLGHKDLTQVFARHYEYYREEDGEIAHQQQSGESAIRRAYSGRMVFELLQNAIDRAEDRVEVQFRATDDEEYAYQLIVANDGDPVRVDPEYPYDNPPDASDSEAQRPDFNALCSLHTSNKSQDESIGTKGSGFRSVFSIETYVQVWSRVKDSEEWWGLEMHSPMERTIWADRQGDPDVRRGIDMYLSDTEVPPKGGGEERPSYHFPLPLSADAPLSMLTEGESLSTGVIVPVPEGDKSNLETSFEQLESHHLYFTGLAEGNEDITVEFDVLGDRATRETDPSQLEVTSEHEATWSISNWDVDDASSELADRADKADLDITYPGAAITWPPQHPSHAVSDEEEESVKSAMYGYLPTIIDGPFGADFHGDFKLSIDRTNIRFDDDIIGPYNTSIARIGAEIHVLNAVRESSELVEAIDWDFIDPEEVTHSAPANFNRRDFWRFLNPENATSKTDIVKDHVANLLFDPDCWKKDSEKYALWAKLAYEFFEQRDEWPIETYDSFWEANLQWVDDIYDGKMRRKNWRKIAKAMCDAFRESNAAVAPIVEGDDARVAEAKSLPPSRSSARAGGSTERKKKELYIWNPNREEFELSKLFDLPSLLKSDDRVVTTYDFDNDLYKYSPKPLGATEFTRWEVLNELRQLPNTLKRVDEHESRELTPEDGYDVVTGQCELIRFAAQLYQLDTGGSQEIPADSDQYDIGWRMRDEFSDDSQRAGRSLATLFLPVRNVKDNAEQLWAPARQLTRDQVAVDRIRTLPDGIDVDAFLAFLGVAPAPPDDGVPLTLVEGGADGCIAPRETPPPLAAAEGAPPDATLAELRPANRPVSNPRAWCRSMQVAYDEWLEPLVSREYEVAALDDDNASETDGTKCWTNLVDTLGDWPWYPVGDSEEPNVATPPEVGHDDAMVVRPREITVHGSRQTQFPKLLYGVEESADSAQLLVALGAIDGLDPEDLRADAAEQAYRLLNALTDITPTAIENPKLQRTLVDLYNRLLEAVVRGDAEAGNSDQLSLLLYERGEEGMALSERRLVWSQSFEEAWIAKDRSGQRTIHQYFTTIPLVAANVAPRHIETYEPLAEQTITLTEAVHTEPSEGISDEITDDLFNRLNDLVPRLLALADASSKSSIDRSALTDNWGPDRFRRAEKVWREITVEFDEQRRTRCDFEDSRGIVLVTSEEPRRIVFDTPADTKHPPLTKFGEALAKFLLDGNVSDLFARALRMSEEGDERLEAFLEDRGAKSLVPTYQNEFDPLSSEEHSILVDEIKSALAKVGLLLETTAVSQLRIIRPDDISVTDNRGDGSEDALTQSDINEALETINLPDSRDWEGYRPRFRSVDSHYNEWERWFEHRETYLLPYLLEFLEERVSPEYSEDSLRDALHDHARNKVCPRITFQPEQVIPSWLVAQGVEDIPDSDDLLDRAKRYESSFESVTEVKSMAEVGIEPGGIQDVTIDPEGDGGTITPEEATRTKRAQMAYGANAEQAALDRIAGTTIKTLKKVHEDDGLRTVFGDKIHDLQDAVDVLCWPFYDGGVTDTHIREHIDAYESDADTTALRTALHVSTVWDGAGFDIIGLDCDGEQLYPVRYEIKSLSDTRSNTIAHLSQKQYAVYKAVHDPESIDRSVAGDWRLYGVTEEGLAIDITNWLDNLPDHALASLREQGIEPDGLVLSTGGKTDPESR